MSRTAITAFEEGWASASTGAYALAHIDDGDTQHLVGYPVHESLTARSGEDVTIAHLPDGCEGDAMEIGRPVIVEVGEDKKDELAGSITVEGDGTVTFTPTRNFLGERVQLEVGVTYPTSA